MKYVYKVIVLVGVFLGSGILFGTNMKEVKFDYNKTVEMGEASFPTICIKSKDYTMNLLHGYNSNMNANIIRESMTPIGYDQSFQLLIAENESEVKKVKYELRKVIDNSELDSGEILVLEKTEHGKSVTIKIQSAMDEGKEYALKVTLMTSKGKKIHYFTRLKYYGADCFLKEKMDFVKQFHNKTFDKQKVHEISKYLESSSGANNNSFANVNIYSGQDLISWGSLKPSIVSEVVPTIKEFNIETACVTLDYFVKANAGSGEELYHVNEFYRVRYVGKTMYLLKFERNMEALFDISKTSVAKSEFKVGITDKNDVPIITNEDGTKLGFVREGELWYYHSTENQAVKVFSFIEKKETMDYIRDAYNQHDIRILDMDNEGNMNFMVYGYMNRGDYEGSVGILVYKFYANEKRIEELVYIPLETTYQLLKENLDEFSYVSKGNVFYFSINNVIYSYSFVAKRFQVIATGVTKKDYCVVEKGSYMAWQKKDEDGLAKELSVLDLETEKQTVIAAPKGENIRVLGSIDGNLIYGYGKKSDVAENTDGSVIIPLYKLFIASKEGNILMKYQVKNIYITDAEVENNIIKLERVKKSNGGYTKAKRDSILNKEITQQEYIRVNKRVTDLALNELYIALKPGFIMPKKPNLSATVNTIVTENKTLYLGKTSMEVDKFYIYAVGSIIGSSSEAADAIKRADEAMGVVINHQNKIVWERAGRYNKNEIAGISTVNVGNGVNSKGACLKMILEYNHISADAKALSNDAKSVYQILKEQLVAQPMNLTGCTLDEILYFISNNHLVIAQKGNGNMVLITAYDDYSNTVTIFDPTEKKTSKMSKNNAEDMFENAGNIFISYLP